jgi:hypothetical protein
VQVEELFLRPQIMRKMAAAILATNPQITQMRAD